jgi:hypothetical protein
MIILSVLLCEGLTVMRPHAAVTRPAEKLYRFTSSNCANMVGEAFYLS